MRARATDPKTRIVNVFGGRSFVIDDKFRDYPDDIYALYQGILEPEAAENKPKRSKSQAAPIEPIDPDKVIMLTQEI